MISICNKLTQSKIISIQENRRKFTLQNPSFLHVNKVQVDDCYIKKGLRCDYLFEIIKDSSVQKVFYIELKGSDIRHATKQLINTLQKCIDLHKNISKKCFIVASKYPKASVSSQIIKKEFKNKYKVQLHISTNIHKEKI